MMVTPSSSGKSIDCVPLNGPKLVRWRLVRRSMSGSRSRENEVVDGVVEIVLGLGVEAQQLADELAVDVRIFLLANALEHVSEAGVAHLAIIAVGHGCPLHSGATASPP